MTEVTPWSSGADTLKLFHISAQKEDVSQNDKPRWQRVVIFVWSDKIIDLYSVAADIAQSTGLPFFANLLPFVDDRALFFCSSFGSNHHNLLWIHKLTGHDSESEHME